MQIFKVNRSLIALLLVNIASFGRVVGRIDEKQFGVVRNPSQYSWLTRVVIKHLGEMRESSPIHILANSKAHPTLTSILMMSYASRHPVILLKNINFIPRCRGLSCVRVHNFVGIFEDVGDIRPVEWKTFYNATWDPRSKFAIWVTNKISPEVVESVLETFWSLGCINVIFLVISPNSTDADVFTYDPFWTKNAENRGRVDRRNTSAIFFPDKLHNLQGLPITVSMHESHPVAVLGKNLTMKGGIQVEIMKYLSRSLNFTIKLITSAIPISSYTTRLPTGEIVGVIGDILKNRSDVLGNSQMQEIVTNRNVEYVQLFSRTPTLILVPSSKTMPGIVRTFRSLNLETIIIITALMSLLALAMLAKGKRYPIYYTFNLLLFQTYNDIIPKTSERLFFMTWIIFLYLFSTIFQSHLMKNLTDPPYYPDIDSLEDLLKSGLKLSIDPVLYSALNNSDSPVKRQLAEQVEVEPRFDSCVRKLITGVPIACAGDFVNVARIVYTTRNINTGNKRMFHMMSTPLKLSWRVLVVRPGFPYIQKFEEMAWRLTHNGLVRKWREDSFNYSINFIASDADQPLNMHDYEGIFLILIVGHCIAAVIFIIEMFHRQIQEMFSSLSNTSEEVNYHTYTEKKQLNDN